MIVVVTILAIFVTATLSAFVRKADDTAGANESVKLEALARGFEYGVVHSRYIPGADWATFIATNLSWQLNNVQTNDRGNPRAFLVDPAFNIGSITALTLPYAQSTNSYTVTSPRFLILSSISVPLPVTSNPLSQSDFDTLWNYPANGLPTGWGSWHGSAADLEVQRIDLLPSFNQLILTNLTTTAAPFALDNAAFAMRKGPLTNFLFSGTVLNLTNLSNAPQISEIINKRTVWAFSESVTESYSTNGGGKGGGKGGGGGTIVTNYQTNFFWVPQP